MTYSLKENTKVVMIFQGHCGYHFISPETDYKWMSKTLNFQFDAEFGADQDEEDVTFPLTWTKICQVSPTEWLTFMG